METSVANAYGFSGSGAAQEKAGRQRKSAIPLRQRRAGRRSSTGQISSNSDDALKRTNRLSNRPLDGMESVGELSVNMTDLFPEKRKNALFTGNESVQEDSFAADKLMHFDRSLATIHTQDSLVKACLKHLEADSKKKQGSDATKLQRGESGSTKGSKTDSASSITEDSLLMSLDHSSANFSVGLSVISDGSCTIFTEGSCHLDLTPAQVEELRKKALGLSSNPYKAKGTTVAPSITSTDEDSSSSDSRMEEERVDFFAADESEFDPDNLNVDLIDEDGFPVQTQEPTPQETISKRIASLDDEAKWETKTKGNVSQLVFNNKKQLPKSRRSRRNGDKAVSNKNHLSSFLEGTNHSNDTSIESSTSKHSRDTFATFPNKDKDATTHSRDTFGGTDLGVDRSLHSRESVEASPSTHSRLSLQSGFTASPFTPSKTSHSRDSTIISYSDTISAISFDDLSLSPTRSMCTGKLSDRWGATLEAVPDRPRAPQRMASSDEFDVTIDDEEEPETALESNPRHTMDEAPKDKPLSQLLRRSKELRE